MAAGMVAELAPVKPKSHDPWLEGTYKTPKGRIITGAQLCSVSRGQGFFVDWVPIRHRLGHRHGAREVSLGDDADQRAS